MRSARNSYLYFVRLPLAVVIALLVVMGIYSRRGWMDWRRMVQQNSDLSHRIGLAKVQKESLERQIESFSTERTEQERVIRQTLGYVRQNETIIEFE